MRSMFKGNVCGRGNGRTLFCARHSLRTFVEALYSIIMNDIKEIIVALAWPVVVVFIAIWYREPLHRILTLLPFKLRNTKKLEVGKISLEIENRAIASGFPELTESLKNIPPESVKELLRKQDNDHGISFHGIWHGKDGDQTILMFPPAHQVEALQDLRNRGLISVAEDFDSYFEKLDNLGYIRTETEDNIYYNLGSDIDEIHTEKMMEITKMHISVTPRGRMAVTALIDAMSSQLAEDIELAG